MTTCLSSNVRKCFCGNAVCVYWRISRKAPEISLSRGALSRASKIIIGLAAASIFAQEMLIEEFENIKLDARSAARVAAWHGAARICNNNGENIKQNVRRRHLAAYIVREK